MYYYLTPDSFSHVTESPEFRSKGQLLYALSLDVPKECGLPDVYKTGYLNSWALSLTWFTIDIVASSCSFPSKFPFPSALSLTLKALPLRAKLLLHHLPSIGMDTPCPYYKDTRVDSTRSRHPATYLSPLGEPSQPLCPRITLHPSPLSTSRL